MVESILLRGDIKVLAREEAHTLPGRPLCVSISGVGGRVGVPDGRLFGGVIVGKGVIRVLQIVYVSRVLYIVV